MRESVCGGGKGVCVCVCVINKIISGKLLLVLLL